MITTNKTPLEVRAALCTTYILVNVYPAMREALGNEFTRQFAQEFNRRDDANKRKYSECTFYELGLEMVNTPDDNNKWLDLIIKAMGSRMYHCSSIVNPHRERLGMNPYRFGEPVCYDYDFEAYPYL